MKSFWEAVKQIENSRFERESGFGGVSLTSDESHVAGTLNKLISMAWSADDNEVVQFLTRMAGSVSDDQYAALLQELKSKRGGMDGASNKNRSSDVDEVVPANADSCGEGDEGDGEMSGA